MAVATLSVRTGDIRTTPIIHILGGRLPLKDVLAALDRLVQVGALDEMPNVGPPHPRVFIRRDSAFWEFIDSYVVERAPDRIRE